MNTCVRIELSRTMWVILMIIGQYGKEGCRDHRLRKHLREGETKMNTRDGKLSMMLLRMKNKRFITQNESLYTITDFGKTFLELTWDKWNNGEKEP